MGTSRRRLLRKCGKKFIGIWLILLNTGCGVHYTYEHISVNGESCKLEIYSARELTGADLGITDACALTGGADSMTFNEKAIEALSSLINKIP